MKTGRTAQSNPVPPEQAARPDVRLLPYNVLLLHPDNMRRVYSQDAVAEMAGSIAAAHGVWQALLITPYAGIPGHFHVIDGNLRLAAARQLGERCPPLKCEVLAAGRAEQMLAMVATTAFVYPKDPISEALHYQRLIASEGLTAADIAGRTGVHENTIHNRLLLLELDEPIQRLVAEGRLPRDRRAVRALLSVADVDARLQVADHLARKRSSIDLIVATCTRLVDKLSEDAAAVRSATPALELARLKVRTAGGEASDFGQTPKVTIAWDGMKQAAEAACDACIVREDWRPDGPAPAWLLVSSAAEQACATCGLRTPSACRLCPLVDALHTLMADGPPA